MEFNKNIVKNWLSVTSRPKKGFRAALVQIFFRLRTHLRQFLKSLFKTKNST